ncbi:MAG TPA: pitrilysin family protein [Vicinamibacterales bacterium]|nr:pitrilysin family protein [Vicinamibacterales bacterium]
MRRTIALTLTALLATAGGAAAQVKDWPSERPPRPLEAHPVKFPPYQVRTLSNGLQVIAVPHHEEPAVSLRLIVRAGAAQDPRDRPGVASLAATLLDQGTTSRDAESIATTIDSIGGALGTGAGTDLTYINAVVMKDSLDLALDLVSDVAEHPAFAAEEIERQRQQIISGLKVSYDDPEYLADMVFDRLVYGFHPYGRPQSGTPSSIAAITREDLVAFHRRWFGANNAILAIVGDVEPDTAFAGAERAFGSWGRVEVAAGTPDDPPPPTRRLVIVDRPGAVQTEIRVGNIAIPRKDPDHMALDLAVKILGGEGANRLHRVLRTERGLTYGASADLNALAETGDIEAETNTRSQTTGETLRLMVDEFWKLVRDRAHPRELADAQAYLTGSFPLTIETPSDIALQILNAVFYGLDLNTLQTYRERVNAVGVEDVQRVAREYLHPDRLTIVLVGDASAFIDQLKAAGFDHYERIPVADLDLSAADLRRRTDVVGKATAHEAPSVRPSPHDQATVRDAMWVSPLRADDPQSDMKPLIAKAIAAKGGLERLRAVRTVRAEATTRVNAGNGSVDVPTITSIAYPDRYRVEAQTPSGRVVQVYAHARYWVQDARGVAEAPVSVRDEIHAAVQRDVIPLLLRAADGHIPVQPAVSDEPGLDAVRLQADAITPITLYIDRDSGLVMREQYPASTGSSDFAEERFSDYRVVDGLQVAFRAHVRRPGAPAVERIVRTIAFNVPLEQDLFSIGERVNR